ncbi:tRNA (adenosine(37)-N6)-threonylcarbamoyltransferase complex transferase subunit TsaD [Candidatus Parcubacteria bacterium]|nr:tRNA (adenosine(37)-N6)-threonylcarbamoyltransferase complex transferase subunit TsaD [Candidatus Parcubacteria bacterium]
MKILAIETSCDETAVSLLEGKKKGTGHEFMVLGNALASQAKLHAKYGGVFPMMAKREHSKNLVPLFLAALKEAGYLKKTKPSPQHSNILKNVGMLLEREPELLEAFAREIPKLEKPDIDAIAVTYGPGLEPALWVGINFAKALALVWDLPLVPVNHMEGHILSSLLVKKGGEKFSISTIKFPMLALLVSGGHTELVLSKKLHAYTVVGETRDDAAGEAFDKGARLLGLPYPGGPRISRLAEKGRVNPKFKLPRPMINSKDLDFSFSGLKTALLYLLQRVGKLSLQEKADVAKELEDAIADVLTVKTMKALAEFRPKTLVVGGGVSANKKIRARLKERLEKARASVTFHIPEAALTTDNALMIAVAGYFRALAKIKGPRTIAAQGNLRLS